MASKQEITKLVKQREQAASNLYRDHTRESLKQFKQAHQKLMNSLTGNN